MRYFLEGFKDVYNREWPFGQFPAWNYYPSTGTHIGTDFKVPMGTAVLAPVAGEMFKAEYNRYKGNVGIFIFTHEGVEWGLELCHLRELPSKGVYGEGDVIAYSGNTGETTTAPHLHAVLHRDAMVTHNYQQLQSRDDFLRLRDEGKIADCFEWFCACMDKQTQDVTEKEQEPEVPAMEGNHLEEQEGGANTGTSAALWMGRVLGLVRQFLARLKK